jgi:hypothetical protein
MCLGCFERALQLATDDVLPDLWYNIGHVSGVGGDGSKRGEVVQHRACEWGWGLGGRLGGGRLAGGGEWRRLWVLQPQVVWVPPGGVGESGRPPGGPLLAA